MAAENRHHEYLAKARDAQARAAKAQDQEMRASWNKIAENYRVLAQRYVELEKKSRAPAPRPFSQGERRHQH
jgi:hypothetical protein